jgi:hypothetical protein
MGGLDNLRPWSNDAIEGFLDRRSKFSDIAWVAATLARLKYLGGADDSDAYQGALTRRKREYRDWLMVQGHTHVPAAVPGVYYNTGTWISSLVAPDGEEKQIEAFPFLLVYLARDGSRVEEYYIGCDATPERPAYARLQTPESVNEFRKEFGYKELPR